MTKTSENKKEFVDSVDIDDEYRGEKIRKHPYSPSIIVFDIVNKKDGRRGKVEYGLADADDEGILSCTYKESPDEDIFEAIHDFVYDHIKYKENVTCDGKKIKGEK